MTESTDPQASARSAHPGDLIRSAREARGWTLSHLSMLLKLPERRLQAFEEGRWDDVGDRTFVRALAQSLCRHLAIDPAPLLQALPQAADAIVLREAAPLRSSPSAAAVALPVGGPRRSGSGLSSAGGMFSVLKRPSVWVVLVILAAAAALAFVPSSWWQRPEPKSSEVVMPLPPTVQDPASAASGPAESSAPVAPPVGGSPAAVPVEVPAPLTPAVPRGTPEPPAKTSAVPVSRDASSPSAEAAGAWGASSSAVAPVKSPTRAAPSARTIDEPALRLSITQSSWIQVVDAQGQVLVSRLIPAGEKVEIVGARPMNLRVGNVAGVQAQWRGQSIDLSAYQRSNVAQVELP